MRLLLLVLGLFLAPHADGAEHECFQDIHTYMLVQYGSAYRDDKNLVVREERYASQTCIAALDITAGTNYPINFFLPRAGQGVCRVLATPPVAMLEPLRFDRCGRSLQFRTQDQG